MLNQSFETIKKLASGGMADIFLVRITSNDNAGEFRILKCIREECGSDEAIWNVIQKEENISKTLEHPNILRIYGTCLYEGRPALVMEYMDRDNIYFHWARFAEKGEKIPMDAAIFMVREAALGLHHCHEQRDANGNLTGFVHRDISLLNILLSSTGSVKISDFGESITSAEQDADNSGYIVGNFQYISPEQAWGDRVDRRADIFSLGVVLYELLTGAQLYPNIDFNRLIQLVRIAQIPDISERVTDLPENLASITMKALNADKKCRFNTALEFADALTTVLNHLSPGYTATKLASFLNQK